MSDEDKMKLLENLAGGGAKIGTIIFDNHGTMDIHNQLDEKEVKKSDVQLTRDVLSKAVNKVKGMFWGYSSNAIIFCVCRDCFGSADNMSQFERELMDLDYPDGMKYLCTEGTISNTLSQNPYMKLSVDKWEKNGAMDRVLKLRDEFKKTLEGILAAK